jgi:hypothetical protein
MGLLLGVDGHPGTRPAAVVADLDASVPLAVRLDLALRSRQGSGLLDGDLDPAGLVLDRVEGQRRQAGGLVRGKTFRG